MREILFRGKRTDNAEWVEGCLLHDSEQHESYIAEHFEDKSAYIRKVISETVGQYTGSKDKNGKYIFEGDILQFNYIGKNLGVNGISFVSFQNSKFGVEWGCHKEFVCLDGFSNTTIEIIGNIHDNPELLEGKND